MSDRRKLIVAFGAGALAVMALMGYLIWSGYREAILTAETTTRNYAAIMEARLDTTLRRADADLQDLTHIIPIEALSKQAVPRFAREIDGQLEARLRNFPELSGLRIFDTDGDLLYTTDRKTTPPTNIADRNHFRETLNGPPGSLVFSGAIIARTTRHPNVVAARAVRDGAGAVRGVVHAAIELERFQKLFQSLDLGAHGVLSIYRADDFSLVVRWPVVEGKNEAALPPGNPARAAVGAGIKTGTMEIPSVADGTMRIYSFNVQDRYPFFVTAGIAREDVLAGWKMRSLAVGLSGLLLMGLLAGLLLRLLRAAAWQEKAMSDLAQSEANLRRFRAAMDGTDDAIYLVDRASMRYIDVNEAACRMQERTREELLALGPAGVLSMSRDALERVYDAVIAGGGHAEPLERYRLRKDGSPIWLELHRSAHRSDQGWMIVTVTRDITERKRTEQGLRASEQKFAKAFRSSPELMTISTLADGRYLDVNEAFERGIGYSRDEVIGRTSADIGLWADPGERDRLKELLQQKERVRNVEVRLRKKSGEIMLCELSAEMLEIEGAQCALWITQDVTQRKAAVEALQASENRFRDLATMSSDWFWEQDAQFRFTFISDDLYKRARFSPSATLGKTRWELPIEGVSEDQWKAHRALLERHEAFENFAYQIRNDEGELRWFSVNGKPVFDSAGTFRGYRGTGHEFTEQMNRDQKLRQTQKMEAIGQLAGGIAHDFNNILAVIRGSVQRVKAELPADHPAGTGLNQIEKSAARAVELVRQILAFSRGQDNARTAQDLPTAVQEAVQVLRAALPATIDIHAEFRPDLPQVLTNTIAVHQMVMNLGINAAHAMADAGRLEIEVDEVDADTALAAQVPCLTPGHFVRLTVRDTGCGMDGETLTRIFEPFYSTKSTRQGTGLGLSVVYGIVKEHGGAIGVKSAPGQGTEFRIYFPALARIAQETAPPRQPTVAAPRGHGERLLFVDDEEDLAILSQQLLQTMGYQVKTCRTGEEAIATFARDPDAFDAAVTDLTMPGMSGLDLAQKILEIRPKFPVILMSGHVREADSRQAQALGLGEIHWKPDTVIDLAQTLNQRLTRSKDRSPEGEGRKT